MHHQSPKQQGHRPEPHPDSLEGMVRFGFDFIFLVVTIVAAVFELILRRKIGTRYLHILTLALAPLVPAAFLIGSLTTGRVMTTHAPISMGIVYLIIQFFLWRHYIHVIHMIAKPQKEELSREDGVPLPLWKHLPMGDSWAMVRFVYEPGLLLLIGLTLGVLRMVTPVVTVYLALGAFALTLRTGFLYYYAWEYLRDILDEINLARRIAGGTEAGAGEEAMERVVAEAMARRPRHLPRAVVESVQEQMKTSLSPELQSLVTQAAAQ